MDGRRNRRNKAVLSNLPGVAWTGPNWDAGISVMKFSYISRSWSAISKLCYLRSQLLQKNIIYKKENNKANKKHHNFSADSQSFDQFSAIT